jgi:hypothetical protein
MLAGFFFTFPPSRPRKKFVYQSDEIRYLFLISSQGMSWSIRDCIRHIVSDFFTLTGLTSYSRGPYEAIDTLYGSLGLFLPHLCALYGDMRKFNIFKFSEVSLK